MQLTLSKATEWPDGGVLAMKVDKKIASISVKAKVVDARDLVETGLPNPMALVPPCADPTLDAGARHASHVGYMKLVSILLTILVLVLE